MRCRRSAELTGRQREIWSFLLDYVDRHGYPPTVREIGEAVGLASPSTVHAHLANLERAGLLRRDPTKPRALELVGRGKPRAAGDAAEAELPKLPLLGQIAAGGPLLAEQNVEDEIAVPETPARRLPPARQGRLDDRGRASSKATSSSSAAPRTRATARSSSRSPATTRRPTRRRSSASSARTAASGCSRRTARSSRSTRDYVQILGKVVGVFREL